MSDVLGDRVRSKLQQKMRVLQHALRIRQEIISSLLADRETGRLHALIHYLTELAGGDAGYLVLLGDTGILSVDFYAIQDDVRFKLGSESGTGSINDVPVYHPAARTSCYGGLRFASSLVLPVCRDGRIVCLFEIGCFSSALAEDKRRLVLAVHDNIVPSLLVLRDHLANQVAKRNLQTQLDRTRKMYETIMTGSHDMIITFGEDARISDINQAGRTMLGLGEGVTGVRLRLVNPDMEFIVRQLEMGAALTDLEVVLMAEGDRHLFCLASFSVEFGFKNDIIAIHGVFKDITDRIEAQRELWQANIDLSAANNQLKINQQQLVQREKLASIGQLAAGVAHEINNPLGFVKSNHVTMKLYAERLVSYILSLEERAGVGESLRKEAKITAVMTDLPQLLAESDEGYHRIIRIVQSLKDFSRIDAIGALSQVDVNKALTDTMIVARNSWKQVAEIETDFRLESMVECYPDELNQVFLNMIVNAAQAIAAKETGQPGRIRIATSEEGDRAMIRFDDEGTGIDPKIRNRIFEPFYTTKPIGQGTGLGLSVAYEIIVKKHHGEIRVEDSELGGACFIISLPLLQATDASEVENEAG